MCMCALFQLLGFCVACYVIYVFTEEDDSCKYYYESFHCDTLLSGSTTDNNAASMVTTSLPPAGSRRNHRGNVQLRPHYPDSDPLARSSFISLQDRWMHPTYVSFQEGCDTWAGPTATTKFWAVNSCCQLIGSCPVLPIVAILLHLQMFSCQRIINNNKNQILLLLLGHAQRIYILYKWPHL